MDNYNTDQSDAAHISDSQSQEVSLSLATSGMFSPTNQQQGSSTSRAQRAESFARIMVAATFTTLRLAGVSQNGLHFNTESTPEIRYQNSPVPQLAIDDETKAKIITENCNRLKLSDKDFRCPISHWEFTQPIIANDGKVYERDAIEKYIKTHAKLSSTTNGNMAWCVQSPLRIGIFTSKSGSFKLKHARKISQQMNEWIRNANQVENHKETNIQSTKDTLPATSVIDKHDQLPKSNQQPKGNQSSVIDDCAIESPSKRSRFECSS